MITCLIDGTEHADLDALHKYLRKLKVKQEVYYCTYLPRKDLWTGEPIPFKSAERYLNTDFVNKFHLKAFVKTGSQESREWAINWLKKRKEEKGLIYPPLQTELRSVMAPGIQYYDYIGGYHKICESLGYKIRFFGQPSEPPPLKGPIVIDTREQMPLKIEHPTVSHSLVYGDYGLEDQNSKGIYIERKSFGDMVGTLSGRETRAGDSNFARFTREIERATEAGAYLIMLVEHPLPECVAFDSVPYLKIQTSRMGVTPDHVFYNLRSLTHQFTNFQPLFVKNRAEAAKAVVKLLAMGDAVKTFDLQLAYEAEKLKF